MTSINLLESAQGKQENKGRGMKSLFIPIAVLIFVFAVWGAAKFYSKNISDQKQKIDSDGQIILKNLEGKNVDRVVDFEQRMNVASDFYLSRKNYGEYLGEIEKVLVSGVYVNSFLYSDKIVEIKMVAKDFKQVARQVLALRNSKYFGDLKIGKTERNKGGEIEFTFNK